MTAERGTLFDAVVDRLDQANVPFALIGAAALAVHGVSRSTLDVDLLVTDPRVLESGFWSGSPEADLDIRRGDAANPLAGVVRFRAAGERDVDIVVGRNRWESEIVARAEPIPRGPRLIPTARAEDLVLLKLYAGGSQDRWDIEQLLAASVREEFVGRVESRLPALPDAARRLWASLLSPRSSRP